MACEPLHVQLDLSNYDVDVVNTTGESAGSVTVTADVSSLDNKSLLHQQTQANLAADSVASFPLNVAPLLANGLVLVKLEMKSASGDVLSRNLYWLGEKSEDYRALDKLPPAQIMASAHFAKQESGEPRIVEELKNAGVAAALENKLTLVNGKDGSRILPAYYSDNYVSLLPGESREITIDYPATEGVQPQLEVRGWNLASRKVGFGSSN